jgi:hypothetical protein
MASPQSFSLTNTASVSSSDRQAVGVQPDNTPATGGQTTGAGGGGSLPLTTFGDTLYETATPAPARLPGTTGTLRKYLAQVGNGTVSGAPAWVAGNFVSVLDTGATGNGTTDDTAAIQLAVTKAIAIGGGVVFFPGGKYKITSPISITTGSANVHIVGAGPGASIIQPVGNIDCFDLDETSLNFGFAFAHFSINRASAPTSGYDFNITSAFQTIITDVISYNGFNFCYVGNNTTIRDCVLWNPTGTAFTFGTTGVGNVNIDNVLGTASTHTGTQIVKITGTPTIGELYLRNLDFEGYGSGMLFDFSGGGGLSESFFENIIIDGGGGAIGNSAAVSFKGSGVARIKLRDLWLTTSSNQTALNLDSSANDFEVMGGNFSGGDGIRVGSASEVSVHGAKIYGCAGSGYAGLHLTSSVGKVVAVGNRIGNVYSGAGNNVGVLIDSGASSWFITGNDLSGNTTNLTNNGGANSAGTRYVGANMGVDL